VPEDLVFLVANASAYGPACDEPYAEYELAELLAEMDAILEQGPVSQPATAQTAVPR